MVDGKQEAIRRNLVAQAMLVWGNVEDVAAFVYNGELSGKTRGTGQPIPTTPEVDRYAEAIRRAGRFVMPDEVDQWLANDDDQSAAPLSNPAEPSSQV